MNIVKRENLLVIYEGYLRKFSYTELSIQHQLHTIKRIVKYMKLCDYEYYTPDIGVEYFNEWKRSDEKSCNWQRKTIKMICKLNEICGFKADIPTKSNLIIPYENILNEYINSCKLRNLKPSTLKNVERYSYNFFTSVQNKDVASLSELSFNDIHTLYLSQRSRKLIKPIWKQLLGFLYEKGYIDNDYSRAIPKNISNDPLPSVYTKEEITLLFSSIDKETLKGKRDYAMLLLASKFGIRASDICNLKFENVDLLNNSLKLIQLKTSNPIMFPLIPEIKKAMSAYFDSRPKVNSEYIFLRITAPHKQLSRIALWDLMRDYLKKADIDITKRKRGVHTLRSSLATSLVENDVPYVVIKEILGHESFESINSYAKIDIKNLRKCALEVPTPIGEFLTKLGGEDK